MQVITNPGTLRLSRVEFDHMRTLEWIKPTEWRDVRFGTSRAGAVDVPMFTTASVNALVAARPEIDWEQLRKSAKGRRSPLATLVKAKEAVAV
ncbi:hypothetical protein ACFXKC_42020 [Streptomyces sp. NPDC059340]|uniref:hypothetical protein n=1 Tax=Streptomyces sp. NPDC059340 TaxID=3346806 RepID=UPI003685281C